MGVLNKLKVPYPCSPFVHGHRVGEQPCLLFLEFGGLPTRRRRSLPPTTHRVAEHIFLGIWGCLPKTNMLATIDPSLRMPCIVHTDAYTGMQMTWDFCLVESAPRHDVSVEWQNNHNVSWTTIPSTGTKGTNLTKYCKISNRLLFMPGILIFVLYNSYAMSRYVAQTCVGFGY